MLLQITSDDTIVFFLVLTLNLLRFFGGEERTQNNEALLLRDRNAIRERSKFGFAIIFSLLATVQCVSEMDRGRRSDGDEVIVERPQFGRWFGNNHIIFCASSLARLPS